LTVCLCVGAIVGIAVGGTVVVIILVVLVVAVLYRHKIYK